MTLNNKPKELVQENQRALMRLPVRLKGKLFYKDKFFTKAAITDISSSGLACRLNKTESVPDDLGIRFRLKPISGSIKIRLCVKNRNESDGSLRLGCSFVNVDKNTLKRIGNYIYRRIDFSMSSVVLGWAAFLSSLDALTRIFVYVIYAYYSETQFGMDFKIEPLPTWYSIWLTLYSMASFTSFGFIEFIIPIKGKKRFAASLIFLSLAFILILVKEILFIPNSSLISEGSHLKAIYWYKAILVAFVAFSIAMGLASLRWVSSIFKIFGIHLKGTEKRKEEGMPDYPKRLG